MAETFEPNSDEWWVDFLLRGLGAEYPRYAKALSYREGTNAIPEVGIGAALDAYTQIKEMSNLNFSEMIANSIVDKCRFVGFRTAAQDDDDGDEVAGEVAAKNRLSSQYPVLADSKATYGVGYMLVLEPQDEDEPDAPPVIVVRDAWSTYSYEDELRPWETKAAVSIGWNAATQTDTVTLFRAGEKRGEPGYMRQVTKLQESGESEFPAPSKDANVFSLDLASAEWVWGPVIKYERIIGSGVVKFKTRGGKGVFEKHYGHLDRINQGTLHRVIVSIKQAFKQLAIESADMDMTYPEGHPRAGEDMDAADIAKTYESGPDALWLLPEGAKMWESGAVNITPMTDAESRDLKNLAGATGTPLYVLDPAAANGSASGADLARETHITAVRSWRDADEDSLAQVLSFAFMAMGDVERAQVDKITTIWRQLTLTSPTEQGAAAKSMRDAGYSKQYIGENVLGMSPGELRRERQAQQTESFASGGAPASPFSTAGTTPRPGAAPARPSAGGQDAAGLIAERAGS